MPVYKILDEMPYEEFIGWFRYLSIRPDGWKEDQRAYMIMSSMAPLKKKPHEIFGTLARVHAHEQSNKLQIQEGAMPAGPMLARMLNAKGGDGEFDLASFMREIEDGSVQCEHDNS